MVNFEIVKQRHTVRNYEPRAIEGEQLAALQAMIARINAEQGLNLQLVNGSEQGLAPYGVRYGKWNVTNYIAMIGPESDPLLEEKIGYYGEQIVLWAQEQGLKTGWLETTYQEKPDVIDVPQGHRLVLSLAIGHSPESGRDHKVKEIAALSAVTASEVPDWFARGMQWAQLAPSAGNQQLFCIAWDGSRLSISTQPGFMEKVDLGIAKLHFELGAAPHQVQWQ